MKLYGVADILVLNADRLKLNTNEAKLLGMIKDLAEEVKQLQRQIQIQDEHIHNIQLYIDGKLDI